MLETADTVRSAMQYQIDECSLKLWFGPLLLSGCSLKATWRLHTWLEQSGNTTYCSATVSLPNSGKGNGGGSKRLTLLPCFCVIDMLVKIFTTS